jgi:hypothetical protein
MVLFWLMWLCLALWGAARLHSAEGWIGLWLRPAPGTTPSSFPRRLGRVAGRWPPGPLFGPRTGPPGRLIV